MAKKRRNDILPNLDFFENTLVRFRPISSNNLDALASNRLYYSTPNNFNDPYDTLIYANYFNVYSQIVEAIPTKQVFKMDSFLQKFKDKSIPFEKILAEYAYTMWGLKKDNILNVFKEYIHDTVQTFQETLRKNVKIICMTEEYLSMLMWSHYADNHKGFAIIYDKNDIENAENYTSIGELIIKKPILKRVTYAERQSDLTSEVEEYIRAYRMKTLEDATPPTTNLSQEKLRIMITEKSPDWSYEKEWRLIPRHISLEHESNLGYMRIKPKGIILGSMCSKENQRQIMDTCDEKMIPVFKAMLNYWEPGYKLEIVDPESFSPGIN